MATTWECPACGRVRVSEHRPWCGCNPETPYRMDASTVTALLNDIFGKKNTRPRRSGR